MPKLGQKADDRPYNTRCKHCGCCVEKLISRFGFNGKPSRYTYQCANPYHNCGTVERDGCEPVREYGAPIVHQIWDGAGGVWQHPGPLVECETPECKDRGHTALRGGEWHPGPLPYCTSDDCEPPF